MRGGRGVSLRGDKIVTEDKPPLSGLRHRFTIEPVTQKRLKELQRRAHPGDYDEKIPAHIQQLVTIAAETEHRVRLAGPEDSYWMPQPVVKPNWISLSRGYGARMLSKYTLPDFLTIGPEDNIVDCGAFVGGFSIAAAALARRLIAVEPAPLNYECLDLNVEGISNISPVQAGLHHYNGTANFSVRDNPTDHSFLPDKKDKDHTPEKISVLVMTIPKLMRLYKLQHIDMLKVEAEGLELEILRSVTPARVSKIAIDAGPEREGQSPFLDIAVMLSQRGYRLANRNYWLYAVASDK